MGQKDSRTTIKEGWHEKFGKIELVSDPASPEAIYIRATLPAEEASAHARWWQMAQRLALSPVSGHLILPLRADQEQCLACSNSEGRPGLKVEYRWFRCSLQQDVKGRREIGHLYPENQLWYLMLVLLRAAAYFETQGSYLGNLHPSNLFIDEQGMLSLFTAFSAPREQENAQRIRASKYEDAFMAPEELPLGEEQTEGEEEEERKGEVVNQNKVDLFNIGLILLSTALLKDFYYLYNRNVFAINLEKLDQYKEQLGSVGALKYRKTLRTFILQFLQVDPSSRGLPSHYLSLLRPHENQILQLQDFDPESLLAVESSPQVVNYDDKASPNSKARRFLSLSKDCKDSKKSKETDASMDQEAFYRPARVERRLFGE